MQILIGTITLEEETEDEKKLYDDNGNNCRALVPILIKLMTMTTK
jgi:hypothetical protein